MTIGGGTGHGPDGQDGHDDGHDDHDDGHEMIDGHGETEGHGGTEGTEHRTPVPIPVARLDDPHLQEASRHPQRMERIISVVFIGGIAGVIAFGWAYWTNQNPWILGVSLG